jgi:hypothetical protein
MSRNNAKRTRSGIDSALNILHDELMTSKIDNCKYIQSRLQKLLREAEQKISLLEKEETATGLDYSGPDAVECECGNTFESGGDYGAECSTCKNSDAKEQCVDCLKICCLCENYICKSCNQGQDGEGCSSCGEPLCKECETECQCGGRYCDRDRDCSMINFGYGGHQLCINCVER